MKQSITTELVRRFRQHPPATAIDVWDTKLPRFVLRVRPSGRHSYLVLLGRGRWYTLGSVEALKPPQARKQAQKRLGEVASGLDPQQAKRAAHQPTLADYIGQTYKPWLLAHRRSGQKSAAHIATVFGQTIGRLKLGELSAWHVEKWRIGRLKEGVTPATANRDLSALRALLNRAVDWGHLDKHPLVKVKALPEDKIGRLRFLSPDEETRLRDALTARDTRRRDARDRANAWPTAGERAALMSNRSPRLRVSAASPSLPIEIPRPVSAGSFPQTEIGDAELFARRYGHRVRFDHNRRRWLVFDGHAWRPDPIEQLRGFAVETMRERQRQANQIEDAKERKSAWLWGLSGEGTTRIDHLLREARAMPPVADHGVWDADPWLLGCPNGVVDLRTGALRPGHPEDRITKAM